MEWDNPSENRTCKNSSTEPTGQLTGSSWQLPHQEVKVHFKEHSFHVEEVLDWSMVSATSVGRPELMSCANLRGHIHSSKLQAGGRPHLRQEIPPVANLQRRPHRWPPSSGECLLPVPLPKHAVCRTRCETFGKKFICVPVGDIYRINSASHRKS